MAMYYYARKLQRSARKSSKSQQPQQSGRSDMLLANGSIPQHPPPLLSISAIGCVSGSGSGAPCASPQPLLGSQPVSKKCLAPGASTTIPSSNSSTTTDSNSHWTQHNPNVIVGKPQVSGTGPGTSTSSTTSSAAAPAAGGQPLKNSANHDNLGLIFDGDGCLQSGRLEALIEHLVPRVAPDRPFIFAFVLSSRLFIRPHELLSTVFHQAFSFGEEGPEGRKVMVVKYFVQLLAHWMELFPYDFRDDNGMMMSNVRAITQKCVAIDPNVKKDVSILLTSLLSKLTALEKFESMIHKFSVEAAETPLNSQARVLAICPDPNLFAEQLTHIELERFSFIGAQEFLQAFLKEPSPSGSSSSPKELKRNRLESYVQWFHRLSLIVATDVCKVSEGQQQTGKKRLRARCIEFWVEVARECFNIGNFNSLMAIITGLNMLPVARLKKTWGKLSYDLLSSLETHMDPSNNFASYRSLLKSAVWHCSNPADGRQKVVIPFLSLLIKDLYFLKEECAQRLPNGHLNFERFRKFARQVGELVSWQQVSPLFPKVPSIIQAIQTMPTMSESALLMSSFECESPEGKEEKELMKSLVDQQEQAHESSSFLLQNLHLRTSLSPSSSEVMPPLPQPPSFSTLNGIEEETGEAYESAQKSYPPEVTTHDEGEESCTLTTGQLASLESHRPP